MKILHWQPIWLMLEAPKHSIALCQFSSLTWRCFLPEFLLILNISTVVTSRDLISLRNKNKGKRIRTKRWSIQILGLPRRIVLGSFGEKTWDTRLSGHFIGICLLMSNQSPLAISSAPNFELITNIILCDSINFFQKPRPREVTGTLWLSVVTVTLFSSTNQDLILQPCPSLVCLCQGLHAISCWPKPHSLGNASCVHVNKHLRKWCLTLTTDLKVSNLSPFFPPSISILQTSLSSPIPSSPYPMTKVFDRIFRRRKHDQNHKLQVAILSNLSVDHWPFSLR